MIRYSELSQPQKDIINKMKTGFILSYSQKGYTLKRGEDIIKLRTDTPSSLLKRHFIIECYHDWDTGERQYTINVEISYPTNYNGVY